MKATAMATPTTTIDNEVFLEARHGSVDNPFKLISLKEQNHG
jgi:hypothetical protein